MSTSSLLGRVTGRIMPFYQIQAHCSCSGIRYTVYHSIWAFFNDKLLPRCRLSCSVGHERKYTQNKLGGRQHNHKCKMPAVKQALGCFLNNWIEIGRSALTLCLIWSVLFRSTQCQSAGAGSFGSGGRANWSPAHATCWQSAKDLQKHCSVYTQRVKASSGPVPSMAVRALLTHMLSKYVKIWMST